MILEIFSCGPLQTNAILLGCEHTKQVALIDPALGSKEFFQKTLEKHSLEPKCILLTHSHWDHIADVAAIKQIWDIPIYIHQNDAENLQKPGADHLPLLVSIEGVLPNHYLQEDQIIKVGDLQLKVISTPGHSPGGVCFYCEQEKLLISGDTLFAGTIGNLHLPTADANAMWRSLQKLADLPEDTRVIPGHGQETTIGRESWLDKAEEFFS